MSWFLVSLAVLLLAAAAIGGLLWLAHRGPLIVEDDPQGTDAYVLELAAEANRRRDEARHRLVPRDLYALALAALLAACAWPPSAEAQQQVEIKCDQRDDLVKRLEIGYHEVVQAVGLGSNGHAVEVYVQPGGATFTILSTRPDGYSCIIAFGRSWEQLPATVAEVPIGMAE